MLIGWPLLFAACVLEFAACVLELAKPHSMASAQGVSLASEAVPPALGDMHTRTLLIIPISQVPLSGLYCSLL
jgi:hypothetical protein